jgi:hypothetical protein
VGVINSFFPVCRNFTVEPWNDGRAAKVKIQAFAINSNVGGGGWSICFNGFSSDGFSRRISCGNQHAAAADNDSRVRHRRQNGCSCRWSVILSPNEDGFWYVAAGMWVHNHALISPENSIALRRSQREVLPSVLLASSCKLWACRRVAFIIFSA